MTAPAAAPSRPRFFSVIHYNDIFGRISVALTVGTFFYAMSVLRALPRKPDAEGVLIRFGDPGYFNLTGTEALILGSLVAVNLLMVGMAISQRLRIRG